MAPEKKRDLATTITIIAAVAMLLVAIYQGVVSTKWNNVENYTRVSVLESKVCTIESNVNEIKSGIDKITENQTQMLLMMNNLQTRGGYSGNRGGYNRTITEIR